MSIALNPVIYPRYCFHASPTFDNWCLLRAIDVHHLKQYAAFEGQDFFFYHNLPLRWVRIVGVVVAIDEFYGRRVFTIDDSSGACIETVTTYAPPVKPKEPSGTTAQAAPNGKPKDAKASRAKDGTTTGKSDDDCKIVVPYEEIDVGHVVDVKGKLSMFRDEMQINITRMTTLRSTEQELALWERRTMFRHDVLDKPWVMTKEEIRKLRKEAEAEEKDNPAARKKKRLREAVAMAARPTSVAFQKRKRREDKENQNTLGANGYD